MALWNLLRRWFGGTSADPAPRPASRHPAAPALARRAAPPAAPTDRAGAARRPEPARTASPAVQPQAKPQGAANPRELDAAFVAHVLGCKARMSVLPTPEEQRVIDRLSALAERGLDADLVPRLSAVLPWLIELSGRSDVSPREVASVLGRDPSLVGEVVRMANSARYRTAREVTDLPGVLMVLGQAGLTQLVTRAALRPIFTLAQGRFGRGASVLLSQYSERCASVAAVLPATPAESFAAYLTGTIAPVGLITGVRVLDQQGDVTQPPASTHLHLAMWQLGQRLAAQAASHWQFPEAVVLSLQQWPQTGTADPLARAVQAADRVVRRQMLAQAGVAVEGGAATPEEARAEVELVRRYGGEPAAA